MLMGRMTIAQIEAFFWTTELGSVQKAAAKLHVAQPTVSLRLRQLDAEVGAPLLERSGRGLRMTRQGHALLGHARAVMEAYQRMLSASGERLISGVLRVGLAEGFAVACLPHLIPALSRAFPQLQPEWNVATSSGLEQDLVDDALDLAVLVDAVGHRMLRLTPIGQQKTVWAASPRLRIEPGVLARELAQFTIVTTPPPTSMYRATIGWFAGAGVSPGPLCICTSLNAAAQLVAAGLGIGNFPARMVAAYGLQGGIAPIPTIPELADGLVYVADRVTADRDRTAAIISVFQDVTDAIGYFDRRD
jgi:DNA-binding transcriptional LysR family regulator